MNYYDFDENTTKDEMVEALLERNADKLENVFREGAIGSAISGAISGAVGGALAGRSAGRRAVQHANSQQPTIPQPQGVPGPKPANMPTNNAPQQFQHSSTPQQSPQPQKQGILGKAVQGIGNAIKGGIEGVKSNQQQKNDNNAFLQGLGSGAAQTQNQIQTPDGAVKYIDSVLNAFHAIADAFQKPDTGNPTSNQPTPEEGAQDIKESKLALAWFEYAHLTEKRLSDDELLQAIKGFSNMVKGKSASDLNDNEKQTLVQLVQNYPNIQKALNKRFKHVLANDQVQILNTGGLADTISQAYQTLQNQQGKLQPGMKPTQLNGAIANAIKGIDDSNMTNLLNDLRLLVQDYGQVEDFTVYSWTDIDTITDILKKYGAGVDADISQVQDPDNTTPSGKPPAKKSAQQPAQEQPQQAQQPRTAEVQSEPQAEETLDPKEIKQAVGDIYKRVKDDPVAIKTLLQKAFEKPANRDEFYRRYNINPPNLS